MYNSKDNAISIEMTPDQQDKLIVVACTSLYRDSIDEIGRLERVSDLQAYQEYDMADQKELKNACEVMLRWHLTDTEFNKVIDEVHQDE